MTVTLGNLPVELTSFVGRRADVAETRRLLSEARLVTLTGLGGVGKTRLALRVAEDSRRVYPDGTWIVELSELPDPALLDQTVVTALGIQDRSARPPRWVLIEHLVDRRMLLVLDNCEHLIGPVAELVVDLLRSCPHLSVLATSREPLGVPGEIVMRVPPLKVPGASGAGTSRADAADGDAVALFEQRAQSALPEFRITDDNRAAVEQICRQLEGLPLPIELAAARLRAMSVPELLRRLHDRFQLLTRGSRNAPSRQQTLRYSIDWSYDLCTPSERWLWTHLAVFAGTFELDAVEGVLAGEPGHGDLLDLVTTLVDKSILIRDDVDTTVRYRMLDTLRDYGWDQLDDPGRRNLQRGHRDWYEGLVLRARADWIGPRQVEWTSRLDREQSNLRDAFEFSLAEPGTSEAALRIASGLHDYLLLRGRLSEGRYWLDRALARDGGASAVRAEAVVTASLLASLQRDIPVATALAAEAHRLADGLPDPDTAALAAYARGLAEVADGDLRGGVSHLADAIAGFRAGADFGRLVPALYWFGFAVDALGDVDRAAAVYEEQLALTESRGEIMWRAMAMADYGSALWRRGVRDRGIALLEGALGLLRVLDNLFGCAWCFEELAWTAVDRDPELAAVLLGAADAQFVATGSPMTTFASLVAFHDASVQEVREALGDKAFHSAFDHGRALCLDDAIARALGEASGAPPPDDGTDAAALTPREAQVADLVAQGLTNKAIAEQLVISQRTVEGHVERIRDKLGFSSRTQIATWVLQRDEDA